MYIVYLAKRDHLIPSLLYSRHTGLQIGVKMKHTQRAAAANGGNEDQMEIGTFLIEGNNEEFKAKNLAEELARLNPTEDVLIAKVGTVVSSRAPEIYSKNVSEKGVLPA